MLSKVAVAVSLPIRNMEINSIHVKPYGAPMNARAELEEIAQRVEAKTATAEECIAQIAGEHADKAAAIDAVNRYMFLKNANSAYPEHVSDAEEQSELDKAAAALEAALHLS